MVNKRALYAVLSLVAMLLVAAADCYSHVAPLSVTCASDEGSAGVGILALSEAIDAEMQDVARTAGDEDTTAKKRGVWVSTTTPSLTINEKLYNNWSAAGNSLLSLISAADGSYKYTTDRFIWDNIHKVALGFDMQDLDNNRSLESFRKSEDKIDITSTFSYRVYEKYNISASVNFKTQFLDGRTYFRAGNDTSVLVSKFMAPGYLTTSIGYEYKVNDWNATFSFLSGKTTFVLSQEVIDAGQLYGIDTTGGKRYYMALGSYIKFYFKKDIFKDFNLYARLELFYDYNKPNLVKWDEQEGDYDTYLKQLGRCLIHETDVTFELTINYKVTKFCALTSSLNMKYDTDFAGTGSFGHWQMYQIAGLRLFFSWEKK